MNLLIPTRLASLAAIAAFALGGPIAEGHPCERDDRPTHKHCSGDGGSNTGDAVVGTATINATGAISSDGGTYHDGDASFNVVGNPVAMQVAMNCQANHFNLNPGGGPGGRRIRIDFVAGYGQLTTPIDSCDVPNTPDDTVYVSDTDMTSPDCVGTDPDWGFDQLLRAEPSDGKNVCQLQNGEISTATARLQTNLRHLDNCKGGRGKCGTNREGIDLNYRDDGVSGSLAIQCTGVDGNGKCNTWSVTSSGAATLEQESLSGGVAGSFDIDIDFVAD